MDITAHIQITRRFDAAPEIPIYLRPDAQFITWDGWHCVHCGMHIGRKKGRVVKIEDAPPQQNDITIGTSSKCRRCKQVYRFILIGVGEIQQ